jgi:hypothetical protein
MKPTVSEERASDGNARRQSKPKNHGSQTGCGLAAINDKAMTAIVPNQRLHQDE